MGTYMSAHISWSQLFSWCTWFTWQSGELGSEGRFSMGSAASATSASNKSGWVRLRAGLGCVVGLSVLVLLGLAPSPCGFLTQPAWVWLMVASVVIQTDSDWTSTQFTICFHLTESHFIWQRSLSTTTQHECAGPVYFSHSLRVV